MKKKSVENRSQSIKSINIKKLQRNISKTSKDPIELARHIKNKSKNSVSAEQHEGKSWSASQIRRQINDS